MLYYFKEVSYIKLVGIVGDENKKRVIARYEAISKLYKANN
jgi:hypothetical protein